MVSFCGIVCWLNAECCFGGLFCGSRGGGQGDSVVLRDEGGESTAERASELFDQKRVVSLIQGKYGAECRIERREVGAASLSQRGINVTRNARPVEISPS